MPRFDVVVAGAGLAGWRAASELRRLAPAKSVLLLGQEQPYDRPALSKGVLLGSVGHTSTSLAAVDAAEDLGLCVDWDSRAVEVRDGLVGLADGRTFEADSVVVTTGMRARVPGGCEVGSRVHVLRTRDDARRLHSALKGARTVAVLGGGVLGCEAAAASRSLGLEVDILELGSGLMARALPVELSEIVGQWHRDAGTSVRLGTKVVAVRSAEEAAHVTLADGTLLTFDQVVLACGAEVDRGPFVGLDGVGPLECDFEGRVLGAEGMFAAGDVAAWHDPVVGESVHREHWSSAEEQGRRVAHAVLGVDPPAPPPPPYLWSDQLGRKIQVLGWPELADSGRWADAGGDGDLLYELLRGDQVVGAVGVGPPRLLVGVRRKLGPVILATAARDS